MVLVLKEKGFWSVSKGYPVGTWKEAEPCNHDRNRAVHKHASLLLASFLHYFCLPLSFIYHITLILGVFAYVPLLHCFVVTLFWLYGIVQEGLVQTALIVQKVVVSGNRVELGFLYLLKLI